MITVMVTGVGAVIGYGIIRSLRATQRKIRVIGTDIYNDAIGQVWCDRFVHAPLTADPVYFDWLQETIETYKVDLLIPGIEQDVHAYADHPSQIRCLDCHVVLNRYPLIELSRDKWKTYEALCAAGSKVTIPSRLKGTFESLAAEFGKPFLLKPRRSYASKGLQRIQTAEEFSQYAYRLGDYYMAQPIVGHDNAEYTVSVFCDEDGTVLASITFLRKLSSEGATAKAWVRKNDDLDREISDLCALFKPVGPTNFQLRRDSDTWKLLEINPRISSATSLRTAFGYNEAEMCVQHFLEGRKVIQPVIKPGFAVRFIEDYVIYDRDYF